jgi:glutamate-1-semialdehyde 2,1-aminomutase
MNFQKSVELFNEAKKIIPGGTNSTARLMVYGSYKGYPIQYPKVFKRAEGSHVWDVDGNEFIDYNCAFGPIILGHAYPKVNQAVKEQLDKGTLFGINHEIELELSKKIVTHVPCADMVAITNTGSDATSVALRIARVNTGKEKIVRFDGHYHGWHDWSNVNFASPAGGLSLKEGVPKSVLNDVIVLPWNNFEALEKTLTRQGHEIAAVICEPYQYNGAILGVEKGFLELLRKITQEQDILLVFDEVITGFRLGLGGAQGMLGVTPDMATFAKAMANGYPISAVAGKRNVMEPITGGAWVGGTYNSNLVSTSAALATITELEKKANYERIYKIGEKIMKGIKDAVEDLSVEALVLGLPPGFGLYFTKLEKITRVSQLRSEPEYPRVKRTAVFYQEMLYRGIFMRPSEEAHHFITASHSDDDANKTIEGAEIALKKTKKIG